MLDSTNNHSFQKAITTQDGKLVITLEEKENHDLNFQSGMSSDIFQYLLISSFLIQACYHRGTNFALPQVMWKFQLVCPGVLKLPDYGQVCNFDFRIALLETHPTA